MSDYGFCTYDDKSGKKINGVVNSKWPIFGPLYPDIKRAFRTIHITDTKQYDFKSASTVKLPPAGRNTISQYHGYEKVLVATTPHGYKKRPMGYATISGSFVKNTRGKWMHTKNVDTYSLFPPAATLYGVGTVTGNMQSAVGGGIRPTAENGSFNTFETNTFDACNITYPDKTYWFFMDNRYGIPGNNSAEEDVFGTSRPPYSIEIDDKNVYLYRHYYWSDVYKRDYFFDEGVVAWDVTARMFGIIDFAGSSFDLTIYLCPYSMEELV